MNKKGQSEILVMVILFLIIFLLSGVFTGLVKLFAPSLNGFFLFLGFLFLLFDVLFGLSSDSGFSGGGVVIIGGAALVCFFLAWFLPSSAFLFSDVVAQFKR